MNKFTLKTRFSFILCFFVWATAFAQNTLVIGKVANNNARISAIDLQVNHRFLDGNVDTYESNILEDGTFAFAVQIDEPQTVNLLYARNNALLYLEPNDTLRINFDANTFKFSFKFGGRSGGNNTYLNEYFKKYPRELDPFKYLQYRFGPFWYKIDPDKDYAMRAKTKTDFLQSINKSKEEASSSLAFHKLNHPNTLTDDFVEFMEAEIYYDWAYHKLLFGDIYKGVHGLDDSYFDFLADVPLQHEQIGSHWYQMFLLAYINRSYKNQEQKEENPFAGQYKLASTVLSSKAMAYVQSEMVSLGFYKKYLDSTLPIYSKFIDENPYSQFDDKAIFAFQKAMKTAAGTAAPDFALQEVATPNLSNLKGKVVLLNFWATWCRPCLKKMKDMKPIQEELGNNVTFVHIAFDKNQEHWESFIDKHGYDGIHLLAPAGINSEIAQKYDVKALPQYFIIDKNGNFAEKPPVYSTENLKASLTYLNR